MSVLGTLAIFILVSILCTIILGSVLIAAFGDVIVCVLLIVLISKLVKKRKESKGN